MSHDENIISIPNENIQKENKQNYSETILSKSILKNDLSYIQQFILSEDQDEDLSKLNIGEKQKLAIILTEFLDQPLRVSALECIYKLMQDTGAIDGIVKKLTERSTDFKKLVVLKGKIDYLKYKLISKNNRSPQNEYTP